MISIIFHHIQAYKNDLKQVECQKLNQFLNFMVLIRLHFNKHTFLAYVNSIWMVCHEMLLINRNHNLNTIAESANNTNVIHAG